jgi:hypothetical protein
MITAVFSYTIASHTGTHRDFSPQAKYDDSAIATGRRILVPSLAYRRVSRWQRGTKTTVVILGFLDGSRYFSIQVAPHLCSRCWVDPVPDPLLTKKLRGFQSASELYRLNERNVSASFSANLCTYKNVAWSVWNLNAVNLSFLDRSRYFFFKGSPHYPNKTEWTWLQIHYNSQILTTLGIVPGTSGSAARNSDH